LEDIARDSGFAALADIMTAAGRRSK
jgi:hypothetical protein